MTEQETRNDRLARQRDGLMLLFAVSWLVWQMLQFIPVQRALSVDLKTALVIAGVGLTVWFVTLAALLLLQWRIHRERKLRAALNDELTRANSQRAMVLGYWALTIGIAAATILIAAKALEPMAALQMLCMLTFIPILRFVWLERAADV